MQSSALTFNNVVVRFNNETIFDGLTFSVQPGEFLCILGPSGCGKSTSLRLMGNLLSAQSGEVLIEGMPPERGWEKLAYVFQSPRLVPWRSALDNVVLAMELRFGKMAKAKMRETAEELLTLVGLENDLSKFPAMLSGGERQRVAIARALSVDPQIILMDEPFSALDLNTRQRMRSEIVRIWEKTGKTVIFVTHDVDEALVLADRILLLSNKPTRTLQTIEPGVSRPRKIEQSPELMDQKKNLVALFKTLENVAVDDDID